MWTVKRAIPFALGASEGFSSFLGDMDMVSEVFSGGYVGEWTGSNDILSSIHSQVARAEAEVLCNTSTLSLAILNEKVSLQGKNIQASIYLLTTSTDTPG